MKSICKFEYTGAIVLGMHDAIVSLTGLIAGLAFTLADKNTIVLSGIIASVVASLSMAASSYLAARADQSPSAIKSGIYTGMAYMATCIVLILPFMLISGRAMALCATFLCAILIILGFNWCVAKLQRRPFIKPFLEMLGVCACVSIVAFLIGQAANYFLGINI